MKLVYVLPSLTFGMHQYTADLANRMAQIHDVYLVTAQGYPADRYSPDVKIFAPAPIASTGMSSDSFQYRHFTTILKQIERLNPAVVHFTGPHLWNVYLVRRLRSQQVPVIHTIHDLNPHSGTRLRSLVKLWNKLIVHSADHILVHGECFRQQLIQHGMSADHVTYTPLMFLFLSYKYAVELRTESLGLKYEPFFLFFGRLESYKGIDTLIEAYEAFSITQKINNLVPDRLVIAGPGDTPVLDMQSLPKGVEIRRRLVEDDEATDLFATCKAVVLPYHDSTQSSLITSAYYFNKPVIATRTGALPEYVEENKTGLLVQARDPAGLAQAFCQMVDNPVKVKSMGSEARKWYDNRRHRETETLQTLYQTCAGE